MSSYGTVLRHASSRGGTESSDEKWTTLSWYDTIHTLSIQQRLLVGVGMSSSQRTVWDMLSHAAYKKAVFPPHYFSREGIIMPDVHNEKLWWLFHEITRETYVSELGKSLNTVWTHNSMQAHDTTWSLIFEFPTAECYVKVETWRGRTWENAINMLICRGTVGKELEDLEMHLTTAQYIETCRESSKNDGVKPHVEDASTALLITDLELQTPSMIELAATMAELAGKVYSFKETVHNVKQNEQHPQKMSRDATKVTDRVKAGIVAGSAVEENYDDDAAKKGGEEDVVAEDTKAETVAEEKDTEVAELGVSEDSASDTGSWVDVTAED